MEQVRELGDVVVVRDTKSKDQPGPAHWLVHRDEDGSVTHQKLFYGYLEGMAPSDGRLWSTFSLTRRGDGLLELEGHESSPSGNTWGRDGSVTFSFPNRELLEWTYHWWHSTNSSLSGASEWSWLELDSDNASALEIGVPDEFAGDGWKDVDISRCSIPLRQDHQKVPLGYALVAHDLKTLFVQLDIRGLEEQSVLEVCSAGEFEPGPDSKYPGTVHCEANSVKSRQLMAEDGDWVRFKIQLPEITSHVTLILRGSSNTPYFVSNGFNFKDAYTLDPLLTVAPDNGQCVLERGSLRPQLQPLDPDVPLLEQLM